MYDILVSTDATGGIVCTDISSVQAPPEANLAYKKEDEESKQTIEAKCPDHRKVGAAGFFQAVLTEEPLPVKAKCPDHRKVGAAGLAYKKEDEEFKQTIEAKCPEHRKVGAAGFFQAVLIGESLPVTLYEEDKTLMCSTLVRGETEGTVEEFTEAFTLDKVDALLGDIKERSHAQRLMTMITRNSRILSLAMCLIVMWDMCQIVSFLEVLSFVMALMVASIPVATEILITMTLALGLKKETKHGAIVTRLATIKGITGIAILCFDKTGTLINGEMETQIHSSVLGEDEIQ